VQFITEQGDYDAMLSRMTAVMGLDRHLPQQVFRVLPVRWAFVPYGWMWSADTWQPVAALARYYGDSEVAVAADAPHSEWWAEGGYQHLGAAWISVNDSGEAYRTFAWQDDEHAISVTMPTHLTMVVSSGGFAMWADRGADIAVFALYDRPRRPAASAPFDFPAAFGLEDALELLKAGFRGPAEFAAATEEMRRNYGAR
jgi:hypothetical protein